MDLKQKLARLTLPDRAVPKADRVARLQGLIAKLVNDGRSKLREERVAREPVPLPGETVMTEHGPLQRVTCYLEPHHCHGRVPIAGALSIAAETIAELSLDESLRTIDPRGLLLLDTETTGLSGGTGTIPFLIGMGWFEDQSLRVEQLLLPGPGQETPMLLRLAERVAGASCLVTYNGKSFDWPLLRNRFVLSRVPVATPRAHLDLLPCARRIFARRLGAMRLVNLEEEVLGMRRERDIDGAEIPQLFWDFVRMADGSLLAPVIEHNANDVIAMAAILVSLAERFASLRPEDEPADQLGVARVHVRRDDAERARLWASAAAEGGGPADVTSDALHLVARLDRKSGDHDARAQSLLRALEAAPDEDRIAVTHLELAKHYEHRTREYSLALSHAEHTALAEGMAVRDHRVARLLRKIEKTGRQGTLV